MILASILKLFRTRKEDNKSDTYISIICKSKKTHSLGNINIKNNYVDNIKKSFCNTNSGTQQYWVEVSKNVQ